MQDCDHSSDLTVYTPAIKFSKKKSNLKRPSTSLEEKMEIELGRALDSSDQMEYLEHNDSHHVMSDDFIADMK